MATGVMAMAMVTDMDIKVKNRRVTSEAFREEKTLGIPTIRDGEIC